MQNVYENVESTLRKGGGGGVREWVVGGGGATQKCSQKDRNSRLGHSFPSAPNFILNQVSRAGCA